MANNSSSSTIRFATFNCRSVKSSIGEVKQLCLSNDIIFLQEHWLLPFELDLLSSIDENFYAISQSAIEVNSDLLRGRPYGGTAILYRKQFANYIVSVKTSNPRVTAVILNSIIGNSITTTPILLASVYMSVSNQANTGEDFEFICGQLDALLVDSDVNHFIFAGDFNFQFYTNRYKFICDSLKNHDVVIVDEMRLPNDSFTYVSDVHNSVS